MRRRPPGPRTPQPPSGRAAARLAARLAGVARGVAMLVLGGPHLLRCAWQLWRLPNTVYVHCRPPSALTGTDPDTETSRLRPLRAPQTRQEPSARLRGRANGS